MRERVGGVCPLQFAQVVRYRSVNVSRWGLGENSADAPLTTGPQEGQHPDPCHPIQVISHGPGRSPPPECDSEKSIRKNPTPRTHACPPLSPFHAPRASAHTGQSSPREQEV